MAGPARQVAGLLLRHADPLGRIPIARGRQSGWPLLAADRLLRRHVAKGTWLSRSMRQSARCGNGAMRRNTSTAESRSTCSAWPVAARQGTC